MQHKENPMRGFLNWFGRTFATKPTAAHRPHSFHPQLEQLDERLVPSLSSAISIYHPGSLYSLPWTERDWYTTDQSTGQVVEFQGTTRRNLPGGPSNVSAVSASGDPKTGHAEVFVLAGNDHFRNKLWLCDSSGSWYNFGGNFSAINATRDGHVYTADLSSGVWYIDSNGNYAGLGTPDPIGVDDSGDALAASNWVYGTNEVFAIGRQYRAIYVNHANAPGQWQLVDDSIRFGFLSATPNNTVFTVDSLYGHLYQETYEFFGGKNYHWTHQLIPGLYGVLNISADTDASGHDEVYYVSGASLNAYLYDQGSIKLVDSNVYDIAAAGGGYFYDVNYSSWGWGSYVAWLYQPNGNPPWTELASGLN
jgi:hypothetical protein